MTRSKRLRRLRSCTKRECGEKYGWENTAALGQAGSLAFSFSSQEFKLCGVGSHVRHRACLNLDSLEYWTGKLTG